MQPYVASLEKRADVSVWASRAPALTIEQVPPFLLRSGLFSKSVIWNKEPLMNFQICLGTESHI
jgi:hypothetical protein